MVFSANVITKKHADALLEQFQKAYPTYCINSDLKDCDNILRVESETAIIDVKVELLSPYMDFQNIFTTGINLCPDYKSGTITWHEYLNNVLLNDKLKSEK